MKMCYNKCRAFIIPILCPCRYVSVPDTPCKSDDHITVLPTELRCREEARLCYKNYAKGALLMVSKNVKVINPEGLHMRPAGELCKFAKAHPDNTINVCYGGKTVNAGSLFAIMTAGINCGAEIRLEVSGEEEQSVLDSLVQKFENGFA